VKFEAQEQRRIEWKRLWLGSKLLFMRQLAELWESLLERLALTTARIRTQHNYAI
jgi:hypothetical protein